MRTIRIKAGRSVWLMRVEGCEVATSVPVSRPLTHAVRAASKMFPDASIDAPLCTRSLFCNCDIPSETAENNALAERA